MNVLVIGKGAREHALCWRLHRSESVKKVYCRPGGDGMRGVAENVSVSDNQIVDFVKEKKIDFVVVGPEVPLVEGIADRLRAGGVAVVGPGRQGAMLEGSKIFAKNFMKRFSIPTADFREACSFEDALRAVEAIGGEVVVKADGLAAGKGVIVCSSKQDGYRAAKALMVEKIMGESGTRIVVERKLKGMEISIIALCDGKSYCLLLPAQDHKPIYDGDHGPNTGGMGAYAPADKIAPESVLQKIEEEVVSPAVEGMQVSGIDFRGILYCGLMIASDGSPYVLEFNVRFGDPETQPQMMLLEEDLGQVLAEIAHGSLTKKTLRWRKGYCVNVVIAAEGYPSSPKKGDVIEGLESINEDDNHVVFHAGTKCNNGKWFTNGGRVLGMTAWGSSLVSARNEAYSMVRKVNFTGMHYRTDIAVKGI